MIKNKTILVALGITMGALLVSGCAKSNDNIAESTEGVIENQEDTTEVLTETVPETEKTILYNENAPELNGLEVQGKLMLAEDKDDFEAEDLILLHKYEQTGVSLYYYETLRDIGYEITKANVVFEYNGTYSVYPISLDLVVEDEYTYAEYDYDGDGLLEVGAALMTNHGSGYYRDTDVYIFDFNEEKDAYELYYTEVEDYADSVNKEVIKLYKEQEGIDYEITSIGEIVDGNMFSYECSMRAENGNPIRLDSVVFKFEDEGQINTQVIIYEALPERQTEGPDFIDTGCLAYSINYIGDGKFALSNTQLKRNELYYQ